VIHERDPAQAERLHCVIFDGPVGPAVRLLEEVITRGIVRGEAPADAADSCVFDAIPGLLMYCSKLRASEWTDQDIEDMIDQFVVPLLRRAGH
jgi:hypothetical protein